MASSRARSTPRRPSMPETKRAPAPAAQAAARSLPQAVPRAGLHRARNRSKAITTGGAASAAAAGRRTARRRASLDIDAERGKRAAVKLSGGLELAVFLRLLHRRD